MAVSYGTYTITEVQEGSQIWTSSAAPTTPNYTFDVSKLVGDSETSIKSGDIIMHSYNRYTVLSVSSDGKTVLAGNLQSIRGATGAASVTYTLIVSNLAIVKDKDGNLSPSTITVTAKSQTGNNAMANYTGRIKIETTTNNSTWTSRINEDAATKTYTIPNDTVAIRCSLYLKGGTTTLLDQQTIPVVSDGIDGNDGKDAYSVILTNENHTFAGNTTSAIASEIECNVIAYKGTTQVAATIGTITGQPTGMTTEILNNGKTNVSFKVNVTTSMVTKNGVLNIPITVDGKSFTKEFTYTLTLDGKKGDKGDRGTNGASQNLLLDAYAPSLAKVDAPSARYFSDASNSTITGQFIAEDNLPDPNATHFVRLTDSSASTHGRGLCFYSSGTPPFITGHTYRIGCWVRKHSGSPKIQITLGSYGSWMPTQRKIENTEWEWVEVVRTFGETDASKTTRSDTYKRLYFYFYNNNVAGSSLDMCGFKMEELQTNSGTARNLLLDTEKLTNWGVVNGVTISDGVASFPSVTANSWREIYPAKNFKYELIRNQYTIFSIKVKGNVDEKCCINLCVGVDTTETAYTRQKYFNQMIFFIGTGEWQTICSAVPIFDYMFTGGSGTVDFNNCWVTVRIGAVNNYWNGFQAKEPQLSLGTTATSWTPAPEDIEEEIASKADSSVAVEEEQLIYISKASGTNTVTGTTTWVTGTGDVQNTWTTKRPTYNSSYPVLFIAKQKKTVSGTVTCTTPLKDDTTTVIDGGHITTGTIDASQVTVTNIDASKITTGTLKADVIGANSLSISQISGLQNSLNGKQPTGDYATNNDVTTAINNIEVGGRNLIINTLNPDATAAKRPKFFGQTVNTVGKGTASTANHGIRFTTTSAAYCYMYMGFTAITGGTGATLQGLTIGETYTFSCDFTCKLMSNDTSSTAIRYFRFYPMNDSTGTFTTSEYGDMIALTQADKGVEKSNRFEYTFTIPEGTTKFGFMFRVATTTNSLYATGDFIEFKNMKLEKGNKATDWTPAQEDTNTEINNAEKVATNYLAIDESGIMVADMKDGQQTPSGILSGNNVFINDTSVNIRDGQNTLASFGTEGMQIGLDNETRTEQDYHSWKMIDKDDNTYAFVSDLRDENGEVTITETAKPSESTSWFETNFEISSIISVTVNGEEPESYQKMLSRLIDITPQPTDEDVVVVTYISQSPQLKAYTFGKRIQDSNIGGYSFVEGVNNVASGYTSHAEGNSNTSSGEASHVEGVLNTAQGYASHAQNFHTTASSPYQTAIGKYNVDDANNQYAFIIGNGELNRTLHKTDYSNALAIGWNGDMQIGGRMFGTLVEKPEHELPTRTSIPLFKTVSWSGNNSDDWNNVTIAKNTVWSRVGFNIYQKGYRALGVVGFGVYPALTNPANTDWCIITRCYTWYNSNIIMEDNHIGGDTLDIYVWNQHQSQSAKVRIFVRVLYIAESAFAGV